MKKSVSYYRISTQDQSRYSLSGQKEAIENYCLKNDIQILSAFEENGESAKNFNRTSWLQLEAFIKSRHKEIDYLIVYKYDRFSRNLTEALSMIDKLEKKYNIIVLSVLENLGVHPKSPMFIFFRTQLLLNANTELNYIKERTKFGMVNGAKQGRHLHTAPFGYKNERDENNKPIITVVPEKAYLVQEAYRLFVGGLTLEQVRQTLRPEGLKMEGNSAMQRLLSNPVYAGLIKVPEHYDDPETFTDGLHQAIVDKSIWWQAQALLDGKAQPKLIFNEEVPLRGVLHCHCGRLLTAGNSKGRTRHYWYYVNNCEHKQNLSANKLHAQFEQILDEFSLTDGQISYMVDRAAKNVEQALRDRKGQINAKEGALKKVLANLESLEEKYLGASQEIDRATYLKWAARWESDKATLEQELSDLKGGDKAKWDKFNENLYQLKDITHLYNIGDIQSKQAFCRVCFDGTLAYENGSYRTAFLLDVFKPKAATVKAKGLLTYSPSLDFSAEIRQRAPGGNLLEPLRLLSEWAERVKRA